MSAVWQDEQVLNRTGRQGASRAALNVFNEQVIACQDQAYTLALYLLGDERAADATVAEAVCDVYERRHAAPPVRAQILGAVMRRCAGAKGRAPTGGLPAQVHALPLHERHALLLVDVLRLSYDDAAQALGWTRQALAERLAAARHRLVEHHRASQPAPTMP